MPVWLMWIVVFLLAVWMFEMFLYPFKQNIQRKRIQDLLEVQKKLTEQLEKRTTDLENTNYRLSTVMALLLKREQDEEDRRNAQKKTNNGRRKQQKSNIKLVDSSKEPGEK